MSRRLLYTSENLDIHHEEPDGWLYADWKGYQSVDMVKSGCEEMLRHLKALRLSKVLNDNTHVSGIWVGAAYWVATHWFPRMQEAGLRHFAWVQSPSRLSQISAETTLERAPSSPAVLFNDIASATEWLRKVASP
ncbi:hypothetical protein [Archangium sp.]|uniref:hypothetical protein n=1 Tax=Archangium sp. TaxID=1872627 RepID=UPI002EDA4784